jgi:hypothetical protein
MHRYIFAPTSDELHPRDPAIKSTVMVTQRANNVPSLIPLAEGV